jgi:hypothetical protein
MAPENAKIKTSISVDEEVWIRFNEELMRRWRERSYSRGIERLAREWVTGSFSAATPIRSATDQDVAYTSPREVPSSASGNEHYHDMLDRILNAGGTYRAAIIANLEGWSRAVRLEDRESEQVTGNPEAQQSGAAGALAYADSALQRAKADREGTLRDEKPPVKGIAKRRASGSRNSQR